MIAKIERDTGRFRQIIRGKIKKELKKYIIRGELIGRKGKDLVSIPLPQIDIPTFRYGQKGRAGVGQGEGEEGTPLASGPVEPGQGAGEMPGDHILEVDITLEELAKLLGEELELPNIEPRGKKHITSQKEKYTGISHSGPESLRHFKRTYKEALKRQLISGSYDYQNPRIVPIRDDKRYRSWDVTKEPESNAVIIYMMDVSGSMGDEEKEMVRIESFWIDTWLCSQYEGIETRYIIHDAVAKEVDQETFYHTRESGGTKISSAYKLCKEIITNDYPPEDWNIYPFHFSDGDNWGGGDTKICIEVLEKEILPKVNLFCYGQVESPYGSGEFKRDLDHYFNEKENLTTSHIPDREGIYDSIKQFLGRGK
jgi:sporulation protein YhbH